MVKSNTVSLCMIVKNEQDCLARCLASSKELVDQIIIVDTGSTDGTKEIALQFGADIYDFKWINDFSAARNYSLDQASCPWILYLDADEELLITDKEYFYSLLEREEVEGYYLNIINPTSNQPGGQQLRHLNLRLFRNNPAYRFQGAIHEQITPSILAADPNARLVSTSLKILHHGYKPRTIEEKNKSARNLQILQQQAAQEPGNNFLRYNLGVALYENKDIPGALEEFQKALEGLDIKAGYAPTLFRNYAICLLKSNRPQQALEIAGTGLEYFPDYTDLHYLKGQALEKLNKISRAQDLYLYCLELGEAPAGYVSTAGTGSYLALYSLGELMEKSGHYEPAVNYYLRAHKSYPDFQDALLGLGRALKTILKDSLQVRAFIRDNIKALKVPQLLQLADLLYSVADYHGCLIYLNEAIILGEIKSDPVAMLKAKCLMKLGKWEEARCQYLGIVPESPYYTEAVLEGCICCWSSSPPKNAFRLIERFKPVELEMYRVLKVFNHRVMYKSSESDGDLDPRAIERLTVRLLQANNISLARESVSLSGEIPGGEVTYHLGKALFNHNMRLEAADYLLDALGTGVACDDLYYMLGCICASRKVLWEAEQFLHQAIGINPARREYHEKLVDILLGQTCATLVEALGHFPDSHSLKHLLSRVRECQLEIEVMGGSC